MIINGFYMIISTNLKRGPGPRVSGGIIPKTQVLALIKEHILSNISGCFILLRKQITTLLYMDQSYLSHLQVGLQPAYEVLK
jgi:hypothetical protein